jgi:hypothetical protein
MSQFVGNVIADSLARCLGYAESLLKDVKSEQFSRLAVVNGRTIESNHPAFAYGHLSLYGPRILRQFGQAGPEVPEGYEALFSQHAKCVDDPDGMIYPPMAEITAAYFDGYRSALSLLRWLPDEALQAANPMGGRMTELFPTLGSLHAFYCGGHMMLHLGQVSAWRRMMDLGAA